jgi:hypothetical protein
MLSAKDLVKELAFSPGGNTSPLCSAQVIVLEQLLIAQISTPKIECLPKWEGFKNDLVVVKSLNLGGKQHLSLPYCPLAPWLPLF